MEVEYNYYVVKGIYEVVELGGVVIDFLYGGVLGVCWCESGDQPGSYGCHVYLYLVERAL